MDTCDRDNPKPGDTYAFADNRAVPEGWALANGTDNAKSKGGTGFDLCSDSPIRYIERLDDGRTV
jgi:hypothetical protein